MHILAPVGKLGLPGLASGEQPTEARVFQLLLHRPAGCQEYISVAPSP